jgi:hypothetical protein
LDPYLVKPNLTLFEKSSATAWILNLELKLGMWWLSLEDVVAQLVGDVVAQLAKGTG